MTRSRRARLGRSALCAALLLLAGCGKDGGLRPPREGNGDDVPTYTQNVRPILQSGCSCHQPGGIMYSVVKLDTYENVYALRDRVRERAGVQGTMPPTGPLPAAQRETIIAWVDGGAPE